MALKKPTSPVQWRYCNGHFLLLPTTPDHQHGYETGHYLVETGHQDDLAFFEWTTATQCPVSTADSGTFSMSQT